MEQLIFQNYLKTDTVIIWDNLNLGFLCYFLSKIKTYETSFHKIFFFIASALPRVVVLKSDADCRQITLTSVVFSVTISSSRNRQVGISTIKHLCWNSRARENVSAYLCWKWTPGIWLSPLSIYLTTTYHAFTKHCGFHSKRSCSSVRYNPCDKHSVRSRLLFHPQTHYIPSNSHGIRNVRIKMKWNGYE